MVEKAAPNNAKGLCWGPEQAPEGQGCRYPTWGRGVEVSGAASAGAAPFSWESAD